jgi:PAS domain S-box-containing protein
MKALLEVPFSGSKIRCRIPFLCRPMPWLAVLILLAAALVPAWGDTPQKVTLQLKWSHQFQFAGYYAAKVKGFYQAEGLDVEIREAGPSQLPLPMVEAGSAEFGVSDMEVFQAYLEGRPLVALGVVFQHSPMVILALRTSGIRGPTDLAGRTMMFQGGQGLTETRVMLESEGLRLDSIKQVSKSWNPDDLLEGRVDALSAYSTSEPYLLRKRGANLVMLRPIDYGVDFYGDLLFTTRAFAAEHPDMTEAFRRASFLGWDYATAHPEEMIDHILTLPGVVARGVTRDQLQFEAAQMRVLLEPRLVDAGHMNPGRFRRIAEMIVRPRSLETVEDPEGFVYSPPISAKQAWFHVISVVFPVALAVGLLTVVWIALLRRTVHARTKELLQEIHQHSQTEQALRESEARYRSILNASPDDITITDLESRILMVSPVARRIWHIEREEELLGHLFTEFIVPEQHERAFSNISMMFLGIMSGPDEYRGLRPDGSTFDIEVNGEFVRDEQGHPTSMVFVIRDITERKQAERTLQAANQKLFLHAQQTPLGIIEWDMDFRVAQWNPAAERIFGYSAAEAIGQHVTFLVPDSAHSSVVLVMKQLMAGQGGGRHSSENVRKNGEIILCEWYNTSLRDANGQTLGVTSLVDDITERRRLEEERHQLQVQLHKAQKLESLGSLAGGVAHDMNNVLGAILGLATANMESQSADSPAYRVLDTIAKAAIRGGKTVKSMLSFARQTPAEERELDINAILLEEAHLLEHTTLAKIRLEMDLVPELWPIRGDSSALAHAFMNLCVNAVDAMPDNGTLILRTRNVDSDWIEVQVEDTGSGMTKEVLEKALEPFFTTKEVGKGTGLGLSMVYSTVKAHQGQMVIQSEPGQGTCVRMRFPAIEGMTQATAPVEVSRAGSARRELNVLVVDDDELIQSAMQALLEVMGHRTTSVSSGEEALAKLESGFQPDVVILDMNMPGLGGTGTLPRLRNLLPTVPVLLATGRADKTAQDLVAAHSDVTLLSKPFSMRELQKYLEPIGGG